MLTNTLHRERKGAFRSVATVSGGTTTTYVGFARAGSLEADAVWQIQKIVETVAGDVTTTSGTFPDGSNIYGYIWSDRESLTYS